MIGTVGEGEVVCGSVASARGLGKWRMRLTVDSEFGAHSLF